MGGAVTKEAVPVEAPARPAKDRAPALYRSSGKGASYAASSARDSGRAVPSWIS